MEDRGNKTIMCSVFFLDIVGYSKKSVSGQISLKDRFNAYLSEAIQDVPLADRIILDTGDGAAINFLGDVEDALKAALSLRENLLREDINAENPMLVRMGINLGPVRLVRDINGQPNIVGDGINVAQRVMGFADSGQVLVSRSYYDAVSRLSPQYANMFHYQGSRTDKHVREHEVYAIGYPGEQTSKLSGAGSDKLGTVRFAELWERAKQVWNTAATQLDALLARFVQLPPDKRAIYFGGAGALLLLVVSLSVGVLPMIGGGAPVAPQQAAVQSDNAVNVSSTPAAENDMPAPAKSTAPSVRNNAVKTKPVEKKVAESKRDSAQSKSSETQTTDAKPAKGLFDIVSPGPDGTLSITCREGTQVFVGGTLKGKMTDSSSMALSIPPGEHTLILSHSTGGIYTQKVTVESGRTVRVYKPGFCRQ